MYCSDWPERGYRSPVEGASTSDAGNTLHSSFQACGVPGRWIARRTEFESRLYSIPFWTLHLELQTGDYAALAEIKASRDARREIGRGLHALLDRLPDQSAYVSSRVVKGSVLAGVLEDEGFEPVEHRRLYSGRISSLRARLKSKSQSGTSYATLGAFDPSDRQRFKKQVLGLCRQVFNGKGYSRYFNDPVLLNRLPGLEYILAVMELNFKQVAPGHFFLALDSSRKNVLGFTVIGRKPCLAGEVHSQLLSAVRPSHQGRGIYYGLTRIMTETLSGDTLLLNVTHVRNTVIQRAYFNSGRIRLADTIVFRMFTQS